MDESPRYENMDQKIEDVERYLIIQVDGIRRLLIIAAAMCAVCVATPLVTLWVVNHAGGNPVAAASPVKAAETAGVMGVVDAVDAEEPATPDVATRKRPASTEEHQLPKETAGIVSPAVSSGLSFRIGESAMATQIVDLLPADPGDHFPTSTPRLYCWTRIEIDDLDRIPEERRVVTHRWVHEDEVVRERTVSIGSVSYRIFTKLDDPGERPGAWRVEVVDASDRELGVVHFSVG